MTVYAPSPAAAAGVTGVITTPGGTPQTGTVDVTVPQTTKDEVAYATAAALPANTYNNGVAGVGATLTANANGALTVDGQAVSAGQRILVKNEATAANNGIYTVTATGSGVLPYILTRATDYNTPAGIGPGDVIAVAGPAGSLGATNDGKLFVSSAPAVVTVGTSAITFAVPPTAASPPDPFGFPYTVDPRILYGGSSIVGSQSLFYRLLGGNGTITKVGLHVITSSGNVSVAVYDTTGAGRAAMPNTRLQTSGAVACPSAGYAEIALGAGQAVTAGSNWLALSIDNGTAAILAPISNATTGTGITKGAQAVQAVHPCPSPAAATAGQYSNIGPFILVGVP